MRELIKQLFSILPNLEKIEFRREYGSITVRMFYRETRGAAGGSIVTPPLEFDIDEEFILVSGVEVR